MPSTSSSSKKRPFPWWHPVVVIATFFWAGYSPKAPGTMGSLATFPFAYLLTLVTPLDSWILIVPIGFVVVAFIYSIGMYASDRYMKRTASSDPSEIVIDEVAGQLLAIVLISPGIAYLAVREPTAIVLISLILIFALFRVFDIIKPSFVGWADRSLKGAHGVMFDDVLAGICAAIVWYPIIMISYGVKAYVS